MDGTGDTRRQSPDRCWLFAAYHQLARGTPAAPAVLGLSARGIECGLRSLAAVVAGSEPLADSTAALGQREQLFAARLPVGEGGAGLRQGIQHLSEADERSLRHPLPQPGERAEQEQIGQDNGDSQPAQADLIGFGQPLMAEVDPSLCERLSALVDDGKGQDFCSKNFGLGIAIERTS